MPSKSVTIARRKGKPQSQRRIAESDRSGMSSGTRSPTIYKPAQATKAERASMARHEIVNTSAAAAKRILVAFLIMSVDA